MRIEYFKMERMQSTWENVVEHNLSESGVHPLSLEELLTEEDKRQMFHLSLSYSQTNGTPELREIIRNFYPGASLDSVLVTNGSSEANFLLIWSQIEPGDEVIFMMPNYMQMWGLLKAFGAKVKPWYLREELGWQPDPDDLKKLISSKTSLIIVTNPNNPTGARLNPEARKALIEAAANCGAWIIADEVYQGAERDGELTASFWGSYDKVFVVNGLSKAYGLPGVRIGWIVGPEEKIASIWPYHDYTTISPSTLSDWLARIALRPDNRRKILERTKAILNHNWPIIESWLKSQDDLFAFKAPEAGAIVFVRYYLDINSTRLVEKLIREKSVLIVPGDHFEMDYYLRFGYGAEEEYLRQGLKKIASLLKELRK
ncbi:MAG: aminotransferase class I/II-fold pyridoxal phosphate-dependent enzyme [Candidatus Aminicenantes bacterium]|nr:aminotransferase class I/II-fold pyridoxal phosphate-dependent enzyme [Candidatus Aminicenantes bacterium]